MPKILMIDDEKDFCFFIKENLELTGNYNVKYALSGEEGLASAVRDRPDLIILDLLMPKMDGRSVLTELKKNYATMDIPVMLLTAIDPAEARLRVPGLPKEAYLTKPIALETLRSTISKLLNEKKV